MPLRPWKTLSRTVRFKNPWWSYGFDETALPAARVFPVEAEEILGPKALATESVMLGLRTTAGIDLEGFRARYGIDLLAANEALVARLLADGHLVVRAGPGAGRWLAPTVTGLAVADGMAAGFDIPL